ncbi:MAG: CoA transferase [Acidimicrobiales bacterium]
MTSGLPAAASPPADAAGALAAAAALLADAGVAPFGIDVQHAGLVLPSVFRIDVAATAAVAALTVAVARVAEARGGPLPGVSVDGRAAQLSFRSERYLTVDGALPGEPWAALSGDYRAAAGGWVRVHANFAHHGDAACRALGVPAERDALAAAIAARCGGGGGGGARGRRRAAALRPAAQWAAHPRDRADAATPVVALEAIGPADPRRWAPAPDRSVRGPLAGVRVLDLTRVIAGPVAGRVLAAHGADVLAVSAAHLPQVDLLVIDTGFGKRSTLLDLRRAPDRAVFDSLLAGADALVESYRPGALAALGYGPAELAERAPGLVVVDVRAYGRRGPWALRRGFDSVVQLASGIAATGAAATGVDRPVPLPCQALDHATGWLAALAVVAGLLRQRAEGGSWRADVALSTTAAWLQGLGTDPAGLAVADPTAADVADLLVETDSAHGRLRHVAMPGRLGAIPTGWSSPPPLLGADEPRWPAR